MRTLETIRVNGLLQGAIIACPHPAARQKDTVEKLKKAAKDIWDFT